MRLRRASRTSASNSSFSSFTDTLAPLLAQVPWPAEPATASIRRLGGDGHDIGRLGAFGSLARLVLDARTLGQALVAVAGDVAVMHEQALCALLRAHEHAALDAFAH